MRKLLLFGCCLALVCAANDQGVKGKDDPAPIVSSRAVEDSLKPSWKVGQSWIVETVTTPMQVADAAAPKPGKPVRWQFKVNRREKISKYDCFRVDITCQSNKEAPPTTIWVDEKSYTLRQIETSLLVQGEVRKFKERYEVENGSSPVIGPLSSLPLDMPLFSTARSRSGKFGYKPVGLDSAGKANDDLGFAVEVQQDLKPASVAVARGLLGDDDKRDDKSTYEVRLKSPERDVKQLWKPGQPWPSYSDNGSTKARLIKVIPPTGR